MFDCIELSQSPFSVLMLTAHTPSLLTWAQARVGAAATSATVAANPARFIWRSSMAIEIRGGRGPTSARGLLCECGGGWVDRWAPYGARAQFVWRIWRIA